jgi:hypothetical protein
MHIVLVIEKFYLIDEDLCGSRTGGWSLPSVMSDWQNCGDWLLTKYRRCRLRVDWCWCRWRTGTKGHCWWGLQMWRRQVGLVRGTWWPAGSSADRMMARTARRSRGRFLGRASKPRSSRNFVGAESWVVIGGGYTEFAGFPVVHEKTTGFLGWSTKPWPKTGEQQHQAGGSDWSDRWVPVRPVCDGVFRMLQSGGHASGSQGLRRG